MGRSGQERCSSEIRHGTHLPGRRQRYWEATGAVSQAAVEVTPVEGATPFAQSIAEYTSNATAIVAPTDSRIGDAYKTLVVEIVKVSTGAMSAEDAINEALTLVQQ